jgi:hypothetical protein
MQQLKHNSIRSTCSTGDASAYSVKAFGQHIVHAAVAQLLQLDD